MLRPPPPRQESGTSCVILVIRNGGMSSHCRCGSELFANPAPEYAGLASPFRVAGVAELADAAPSQGAGRKPVWVPFPSPAPTVVSLDSARRARLCSAYLARVPRSSHAVIALRRRRQVGASVPLYTEALLAQGLERRQLGTIVETLAQGVFEVEFSHDRGHTYASVSVPATTLPILHHQPAGRWRALFGIVRSIWMVAAFGLTAEPGAVSLGTVAAAGSTL